MTDKGIHAFYYGLLEDIWNRLDRSRSQEVAKRYFNSDDVPVIPGTENPIENLDSELWWLGLIGKFLWAAT